VTRHNAALAVARGDWGQFCFVDGGELFDRGRTFRRCKIRRGRSI